ncbi:MAG: sodium-dependent transporter [Deltaproteobacteria bacterium]|nr:sodium-dependent transporter [Deltaproteobacteria bacterium]
MQSSPPGPAREQWSSRIGFVLAAAGSAIGLGNIWRFPYVTGQNGGGAFLILYLACVVLLGAPVMVAELAIGRHGRRNPVGSFEAIRPGSFWKIIGYAGVLTGVGILSYYAVMAGYTLGYIFKSLAQDATPFADFAANPLVGLPLFAVFLVLTVLVVYGGIRNGIERWSMILMPLLLALLLVLIARSVTLEGAERGLAFYLKPDFGKVTGHTIVAALGQAFFSLSLGMGAMITYGSYLSKRDNILVSGVSVALADTLIAFLAGLLIFPALFASHLDPTAGPSLVFEVLPRIFGTLPAGRFIGAAFFLLLSIAALTSTISLLEVATAYLVDEHKLSRHRSVWVVALVALLVGIPSALSFGSVPFFSKLPWIGWDFLSLMDWIFGNLMLTLGALGISVFFAWVWKTRNAALEIREGCPGFDRIAWVLDLMLKVVCPIGIVVILVFLFLNLG